MSTTETQLMPIPQGAVALFGKGDELKSKRYLLMIAAFLESRSENTKRIYGRAIREFFETFEWVSPEDVTPAHAAAYKKWMKERRMLSDSTAYVRMSALSSLFEFLCRPSGATQGALLTSNPFKLIDRNDIQPTPYARSKAMEWDTLRTILDALPSTAKGMRDKAILLFFAFTGRRRFEVANLRIRDLDVKASPKTYTVRMKGGREQKFELPDICYDAIRAYWLMADRLASLRPDSGVFTPVVDHTLTAGLDPEKPISVRSINRILEEAAARAGVDTTDAAIRIHAIRHMSARELDAAGVPLQDIQAFLGHASPVTTQIYLNRLSGPAPAHTDVFMKARSQAEALGRELLRTGGD